MTVNKHAQVGNGAGLTMDPMDVRMTTSPATDGII